MKTGHSRLDRLFLELDELVRRSRARRDAANRTAPRCPLRERKLLQGTAMATLELREVGPDDRARSFAFDAERLLDRGTDRLRGVNLPRLAALPEIVCERVAHLGRARKAVLAAWAHGLPADLQKCFRSARA